MACKKIFSIIAVSVIAITSYCDENLQKITPILSNRFGQLVVVRGNIVCQKKNLRTKIQSEDIIINIYCVDEKKIIPQTMLLSPFSIDIQDSMKLIKKDVKLMGYEIIKCIGIPDCMDYSVQSTSFHIEHYFVVTKIYNNNI